MNDRLMYMEVIQAMKKARDREDNASDSDNSISKPTNRGNKLKRKARYMSKGPLRQSDKLRTPRERLFYNGYEREIISRNPPRVDVDGDVIDNPDEEEDAELTDADENPYRDVKIEQILRPLTNAADLHSHISLSEPYRSRAIDEMIEQAKNMVFTEQRKLSKMQAFMTSVIGDNAYVPLGNLETEADLEIVGAPLQSIDGNADGSLRSGPGSVISLGRSLEDGATVASAGQNGEGANTVNGVNGNSNSNGDHKMEGTDAAPPDSREEKEDNDKEPQDVEMQDATTHTNGNSHTHTHPNRPDDQPQEAEAQAEAETEPNPDAETENPDDETQPHRMTTRSRVAAPTHDSPPTTPKPQIHPLFLLSESLLPAPPAGLGSNRGLYHDLLRQTASYVQKQQEVVRQCNDLYDSLLKAKRYRDTVWQWCRAEGHVGEMSDGEDWIDEEQWGLEAYPKKGEEVEDEDEIVSRRNVRQPRRAGGKA